jgi:hypothetical protein
MTSSPALLSRIRDQSVAFEILASAPNTRISTFSMAQATGSATYLPCPRICSPSRAPARPPFNPHRSRSGSVQRIVSEVLLGPAAHRASDIRAPEHSRYNALRYRKLAIPPGLKSGSIEVDPTSRKPAHSLRRAHEESFAACVRARWVGQFLERKTPNERAHDRPAERGATESPGWAG